MARCYIKQPDPTKTPLPHRLPFAYPPPPPKTVVLELTEKEAATITNVLGAILVGVNEIVGLHEIFELLRGLGLNRELGKKGYSIQKARY